MQQSPPQDRAVVETRRRLRTLTSTVIISPLRFSCNASTMRRIWESWRYARTRDSRHPYPTRTAGSPNRPKPPIERLVADEASTYFIHCWRRRRRRARDVAGGVVRRIVLGNNDVDTGRRAVDVETPRLFELTNLGAGGTLDLRRRYGLPSRTAMTARSGARNSSRSRRFATCSPVTAHVAHDRREEQRSGGSIRARCIALSERRVATLDLADGRVDRCTTLAPDALLPA